MLHTRPNPVRRRLVVALLLALALVAAACGGDDSGDASTTEASAEDATTTTEGGPADTEPTDTEAPAATEAADDGEGEGDVELTASARGVTAETISIGVSMLDFPGMAELGLVQSGWGDQQLVWETLIADLNERGGINGRTLEATYAFYSPVGEAEAEAACAQLTQDVETFAVLGGFLGPAAGVNTCVTNIGDTMLVGGTPTPDRLAESTAPWVLPGPQLENRLEAMLNLLDEDGRVEGASVAIVGSVELGEFVTEAQAGLESRGATVVSVLENEIAQGDIQAENDVWEVLAERIRVDGADTVFVIGSGQAAMRGIFDNALDVEVWVLNEDDLNNLGANTPKETAEGAISISGQTDQEQWESEGVVACREVFSAANPDVEVLDPVDTTESDEAWFNSIMNYCGYLALFEIIATEAGPDLTYDSVNEAMEGLTDFSLPGFPFASLGGGKAGASDTFRLTVFDPDASEPGELVPLTDVMDATP